MLPLVRQEFVHLMFFKEKLQLPPIKGRFPDRGQSVDGVECSAPGPTGTLLSELNVLGGVQKLHSLHGLTLRNLSIICNGNEQSSVLSQRCQM